MDEISGSRKNYLKNIGTSRGRTVRLEIVGEVSTQERHFLDGIVYFAAGTMTRDDHNHTNYVADELLKLVRGILAKLKAKKSEDK
ncbi:MAG: hypothetical protein PHV33_13150 [Elusimicrobiales bacterium]|nr:hypothetical protein [Elusimicrobiales bacterium]